jgi:hypothetical protein
MGTNVVGQMPYKEGMDMGGIAKHKHAELKSKICGSLLQE